MQHSPELPGRIPLHRRQRMRIHVQRNLDALMAKPFRHDLDRNTGLEKQRCTGMAKTVERDPSHTSGLHHACVFPLADIIHKEGIPEVSAEDEAMISVGRA